MARRVPNFSKKAALRDVCSMSAYSTMSERTRWAWASESSRTNAASPPPTAPPAPWPLVDGRSQAWSSCTSWARE